MSVLLIGCGRMGGALAAGWREREEVSFYDPAAADLEGVRRLQSLEDAKPAGPDLTVVIAVKPQVLPSILPDLRPFAETGALIISIAAGITLSALHEGLGPHAKIVRAMPNTPASVGRGITAAVAGSAAGVRERERAGKLLSAVGEVVWLDEERQMDAVTAISGSGPAYFFRFTEALAAAGAAEGLPPEIATRLARATLVGAGALAHARGEEIGALRREVTSPGGTTAAALTCFDEAGALDAVISAAVAAAAARSRELSR